VYFDDEYTTFRRAIRTIQDIFGQFVTLSIDQSKYPIAEDLNINKYTVNVLSLLIRSGVDLGVAMGFINQPSIKYMVNIMRENEGQYSDQKGQLNRARYEYLKAYRAKFGLDAEDFGNKEFMDKIYDIDDDDIRSGFIDAYKEIVPHLNEGFKNGEPFTDDQATMAATFYTIFQIGNDLRRVTKRIKNESNSNRPRQSFASIISASETFGFNGVP